MLKNPSLAKTLAVLALFSGIGFFFASECAGGTVDVTGFGRMLESLIGVAVVLEPQAGAEVAVPRILLSGQPLPQQVGKGELRILPAAGVRQMLFDQFSEPESLIKLVHQDQAAVRGDAGTLEIDLERGVEGELKGLILYLTHYKGAPLWSKV